MKDENRIAKDWEQLIKFPPSFKEFKENYINQTVPFERIIYDLLLLLHEHQDQINEMKRILDK